jgi:hypothetical protein
MRSGSKYASRSILTCLLVEIDFSAGAKARVSLLAFAARLKSGPDYKATGFRGSKLDAGHEYGRSTAVFRLICGMKGMGYICHDGMLFLIGHGFTVCGKRFVFWTNQPKSIPQGLKPILFYQQFAARLKPCPDTKPGRA